MRRPNKATVADEGLGAAFTEGVNEGFRLTGYVLIVCQVGDRETINGVFKASQVYDVIGDFIAGLRGEHYEIGVTIRMIAESDAPEPTKLVDIPELADGVEDAEIVE